MKQLQDAIVYWLAGQGVDYSIEVAPTRKRDNTDGEGLAVRAVNPAPPVPTCAANNPVDTSIWSMIGDTPADENEVNLVPICK